MAYLLDVAAEAYFPLAPHHTFGRLANSVDTHIDKPYVSKLHAAIEWNGEQWRIKNLGLNGTWINGLAMAQGETRELAINDEIVLAAQNDPCFKVMDLHAPNDMLWPLDRSPQVHSPIYLSRYHLLPEGEAPELALYFDEQAKQWYREAIAEHGDALPLNDGDLDEETTQLELRQQQVLDLAVRTHHYLLLQLARHRAEDAARGLDSKSQGWVYAEDLAAELGLDSTHMNIQIFRARKQLSDMLPDALGQHCLLERRGGKIRFGCEKFKIFKGEQLTLASPVTAY